MINKILRRTLGLEVRRIRSIAYDPKEKANSQGQPVNLHFRWDRQDTTPPPHYLGVCAIFKNEAAYLREWIEFHKLAGVEKFFLYNNNSTDDFLRAIQPYLRDGTAILTDWTQQPPFNQRDAYHHCLEHYGFYTRWLAFLDIDEFVHTVSEKETLPQALHDYEEHPAVAIHWLMFGPSGHILKPDGLVTENFRLCNPEGSKTMKVIVDPRRVEYVVGPHSAVYTNDALAVDENFKPVRWGSDLPPTIRRLRVNHYWTKSVEEFYLTKLSRGHTDQTTYLRDFEGLSAATRTYSLPDETIQRFVPQLKQNCPPGNWPVTRYLPPETPGKPPGQRWHGLSLQPLNALLQRVGNVEIRSSRPPAKSTAPQKITLRVQSTQNPPHYLGVCAIFKNETAYLQEWIEFHLLAGVTKFFLYNNNSTDDFLSVLQPYIDENIVVLENWPFPPPCQKEAYNHCISHHGHEVRWMSFIDIDEFVYAVNEKETLCQALSDYEQHPAVAVHWLMFGPDKHILKPEGLVTKNFCSHQPLANKVVKVIVDPRRVDFVLGPHSAIYSNSVPAVDENFKPVYDIIAQPPSIRRFCINHYWTRSVEEFFEKVERGNADNAVRHRDPTGIILAAHLYDGANNYSLKKFEPQLKEAIALRSSHKT